MIIELLALALASTVRPTSLAAVSALLAHTRRRRLMFAYVVVGLAFTVGFGVVVVGAMHGIHLNAGTDEHRGVLDIVSGTVIVLFGVAVMTGLVRRRQGHAARLPADRLVPDLRHDHARRQAHHRRQQQGERDRAEPRQAAPQIKCKSAVQSLTRRHPRETNDVDFARRPAWPSR